MSGLTLPPGSRERLRSRDRRYVYAPVQGQLSLASGAGGVREVVQRCSMIYSASPPRRWILTERRDFISSRVPRVIRRLAFALLLLPSILAIYGCGGELPQGAVAQVGQGLVTQEQFDQLQAAYEAAGRVPDKKTQSKEFRTFQQSLAQYLVMLEVLRQQAPKFRVAVTDNDVQTQVDQIKEMFQVIRRGSTTLSRNRSSRSISSRNPCANGCSSMR